MPWSPGPDTRSTSTRTTSWAMPPRDEAAWHPAASRSDCGTRARRRRHATVASSWDARRPGRDHRPPDRGRRHPQSLEDIRPTRRRGDGGMPAREPVQGARPGPVRSRRRRPRRVRERRRRRDLLHHGTLRVRKVDAGAPHQPADRAHRRRDPHQRHGCRRPRRGRPAGAPGRQDRHGVPEHGPAPAPNRAGQCRLRSRAQKRRCLHPREGGQRDDRARRPRRVRRPHAVRALGGDAATGRPCPGHGRKPGHPADG